MHARAMALLRISHGLHTMRGYLTACTPDKRNEFLVNLVQGAIDELATLPQSEEKT